MSRAPLLAATVASLALAAPSLHAGKKPTGETPLTVNVYGATSDGMALDVVDEQDTTAFYHDGTEYCGPLNLSGPYFYQPTGFGGDLATFGPSTAYDVAGWARVDNLLSTRYADGADCGPAGCLRARFTQGGKTLTLDTQGTNGRTVTLLLSQPCAEPGCPGPGGNVGDVVNAFGGDTPTVTGLLDVFLEFPYGSLGVCSSITCVEAGNAYAKFWFTDPAGRTWRLDWNFLRVLRMDANTWYFIADECDGSQVAGLSWLDSSKRKQPRTVFNGYYNVPFFVVATQP